MPPKIIGVPTARMQTRISNKNTHPGLIDISPSKRGLATASAKKPDAPTTVDHAIQAAKEAHGLQQIAEMEDQNHLADKAFEGRLHDPAPSKTKGE
jgi:hypothetical protein